MWILWSDFISKQGFCVHACASCVHTSMMVICGVHTYMWGGGTPQGVCACVLEDYSVESILSFYLYVVLGTTDLRLVQPTFLTTKQYCWLPST